MRESRRPPSPALRPPAPKARPPPRRPPLHLAVRAARYPPPNQVDECLGRRVDSAAVVGGYQVEEQATHDRQPEAHQRWVVSPVIGKPRVHGPRQHPGERLLTLDAARVALEEEALEWAQVRPAKVGPHGGDRRGRFGWQLAQQSSLAALDLLDNRQQEFVPRAEVVMEHAVAGADRRGGLPGRLRRARLVGLEPLADRGPGPVQSDEPGNRSGPFGPALDVAEHVPDDDGRRIDLNAALSNHVPNGT